MKVLNTGIRKNSKNKENAIKFLEFLVSNEAQKIYAEVNFEYPIRKNIELKRFMKKYNNFVKDDINLSDLAKLNKKAFFIPTPGQFEQEYLAKKLDEQKLVPTATQDTFTMEMLEKIDDYKGLAELDYELNYKKLFSLFKGK